MIPTLLAPSVPTVSFVARDGCATSSPSSNPALLAPSEVPKGSLGKIRGFLKQLFATLLAFFENKNIFLKGFFELAVPWEEYICGVAEVIDEVNVPPGLRALTFKLEV